MQAGEPEQPVQQSVVIASMRGRFLRAAFPSPSDIGQCFSTMSNIQFPSKFECGATLLPIADWQLPIQLLRGIPQLIGNRQSTIGNDLTLT